MKDQLISLSICLSDIPKDQIRVSEKNGKKYISITIRGKEKDAYGNDVYATMSQTKEEREAKKEFDFVGSGIHYSFTGDGPKAVEQMKPFTQDPNNPDDLPF